MANKAADFEKANLFVLRALLHDFINPLTVVVSAAEVCLADDHMQPEQLRRFLERIRAASQEQKSIIDWARNARGFFIQEKSKTTEIDIVALINRVWMQILETGVVKSRNLEWHLPQNRRHFFLKVPKESFVHLLLNPLLAVMGEVGHGESIQVALTNTADKKVQRLKFEIPGVTTAEVARIKTRMGIKNRAIKPSKSAGIIGVSLPVAKMWLERLGGGISVRSYRRTSHALGERHGLVIDLTIPASFYVKQKSPESI